MRIDRYQVERLIGQGAMGKVYLARDAKIGRQVAIKVLATGADETVRERFRLEARAIAALKHPNIVELYDYSGESASDLFLVMEYVPGPSLAVLQQRHGNFSEPTALCVGHELCLALAHAHQVVHRDLKPENVLLCDGRVVLTDFGVVKAVAKSPSLGVSRVRTRTQVLGTPGFMAPEQFTGRNIDARTDIFSLGAVLYCLTTGRVPYEGATIDILYANLRRGRFRHPRELQSTLSPGFCELLERCLAPQPRERHASAEEVRAHILALLASHGVSEVRQELALYEKSPATYALEQRQRSVDVLLRDLKLALRERDVDMANAILKWVQTLAPLDRRMLDVTGVGLDAHKRPVVEADVRPPTRWGRTLGAAALGMGVGFAAAVGLGALAPASWSSVQGWAAALLRLLR